jgi:hypothetical protein
MEIDAMQDQATVFSQALQHVPWGVLSRETAMRRADRGVRRLDCRSHLAALLIGQCFGARGLRDIEAAMKVHAGGLARRGIAPARRSTLSDANRSRDPALFEALIPPLLARLRPKALAVTRARLHLIDATVVHPGAGAASWAKFQDGLVAAKVHVVYDPAIEAPTFFQVTSANTNDITVAKTSLPITPGATYVFDLGYYDYRFWADLDAADCRLVTRLKKNTVVTVVGARPKPGEADLLADTIVRLPPKTGRNRRNPFDADGRVVEVRREDGRVLRLFTNDLTSSARQIADLYKTRWDIELFFRTMKQTLRIKTFIGRSENAVRLQIVAAIIVYIIMKIIHRRVAPEMPFANFMAMMSLAIFHRIAIPAIVARATLTAHRTPPPPPRTTLQYELPM